MSFHEPRNALAVDHPAVSQELRNHGEALGLAVFDTKGDLLVFDGPADLIKSLPLDPIRQSIKRGQNTNRFGRTGSQDWIEEAFRDLKG